MPALAQLAAAAAAVTGAAASAAQGVAPLVRTPFGMSDPACVLEAPHLATVAELPGRSGVEIRHANGTVERLPPCSSPHAITYESYAASRRAAGLPQPPASTRGAAAPPAIWNGWPKHLWFGLGYASFTNPALKGHILNMTTYWSVPARPQNTRGNASDPWGGYAPTLSTWIGVQGGAVLQPVLEWNGLVPGDWDLVSWNCCPAGYVVHSATIDGLQEGDVMYGEVSQSASAPDNVFNITSTLLRGGVPLKTVSLGADMRNVSGWEPTWAEAISETYFVTDCHQLPCGTKPPMADFATISLTTTDAPGGLTDIPWSHFYEVEDGTAPKEAICAGAATPGAGGLAATIDFQCA